MFNLTVLLAPLTFITLQRPSVRSRLKLTDRSFTHHAPVLWNSLPKQLRQPSALSHGTATDSSPLLALSSHQFHSKLKTFLFEQSFSPYSCLHQLLSVLWPLDLASGFHLTVIFTQSLIFTSFIYLVSVNKPLSVIAAWQALYRHYKFPH